MAGETKIDACFTHHQKHNPSRAILTHSNPSHVTSVLTISLRLPHSQLPTFTLSLAGAVFLGDFSHFSTIPTLRAYIQRYSVDYVRQ